MFGWLFEKQKSTYTLDIVELEKSAREAQMQLHKSMVDLLIESPEGIDSWVEENGFEIVTGTFHEETPGGMFRYPVSFKVFRPPGDLYFYCGSSGAKVGERLGQFLGNQERLNRFKEATGSSPGELP